MIEEITAWVRRQVDEDEWWAREASRTRGQEGIPEGEHWQWVNSNSDEPIDIEPTAEDYVYGSLRSVEEYPTDSVGPLPSFIINGAEEVPMTVAGYILRHDPASVLRRVAATRRILDDYEMVLRQSEANADKFVAMSRAADRDPTDFANVKTHGWEVAGRVQGCRAAVVSIAHSYEGRPGWKDEWSEGWLQ